MPTLDQAQTAVNNGKLFSIKKIAVELVKFKNGGCGDLETLTKLKRVIRALQFQIDAGVNNDTTTSLYFCLLGIIGNFGGSYQLDPSVSIPGMVVATVNVLVGYNSDKIPFQTTSETPGILLDNYHTLYYPLYGNNPELAIYNDQGIFVGDEATPPNITYQDGDPTKDILSISWDYPVATTGYVQISGVSPISGSAQGGSGVQPALTFTETSLVADDTDPDNPQWYLPLAIPSNKNVVMVKSNNVTVTGWIYNTADYDPGRIYGFANNNSQIIKVQII